MRSESTVAPAYDIPRAERRLRLFFDQLVFDAKAREMGYADMRDAVKSFALVTLNDLARELGYENLLDFARQRNEA